MKRMFLLAGLSGLTMAALPAQAAPLANGGTAVFDTTSLSGSTLVVESELTGSALTFSAAFRSAVYRNSDGTLSFVYQVRHLGAGTTGANNRISGFTVADFGGFSANALRDGTDHDGAGPFTAAMNTLDGTGFTSLARRNADGSVLTVDFRGNPNANGSVNDLVQGETSTSYIFRTNAFAFKPGTFGVIDGSTFQGLTYAPAVPEPAGWAMMITGFGLAGLATRRARRPTAMLA